MREITTHRLPEVNDPLNNGIRLEPADDPGLESKGHDLYQAFFKDASNQWGRGKRIEFQRGPVKRIDKLTGAVIGIDVNGFSIESILAICIDRLACFQTGKFACKENTAALDHLKDALLALHHRTLDWAKRGVEGEAKA
jgi:hypothetical protein